DTGGTNADGDDECTLRAALDEVNAAVGTDAVEFAIPATDANHAAGIWTITPTSGPYDDVTGTATIDATTQPGWVDDPIIGLDGTGYAATPGSADDGLELVGDDSSVAGLAIYGFADELIQVSADRVTIRSSWFGVDPTGTVVTNPTLSTTPHALQVSGDDFVFGGPTDADGNVVAANSDDLVLTSSSTGGLIENNHFGVAADGVTALGTGPDYGLRLRGDSADTIVRDNQFGNLAAGAIRVDGNATATIIGNLFGTDSTLTASLPIEEALVVRESAVVRFGGTGAGEGNTVRNATGPAIDHGGGATETVTVLGNSIVGSVGLAIDLDDDGVTANDAGDGDTGPNDYLNFPVMTSATVESGTVTIGYELDVPAGDYRIEFFANPSGADPSGHGEGETFVHATTVTHTGSGAEPFSTTYSGSLGQLLTATATEDLGGSTYGATSEFSAAISVVVPDLEVNSTGDGSDATPGDGVCDTGGTNADGDDECTLRAAIEEINAAGGDGTTVEFAIPTSDPNYTGGPDAFTLTPASPYPVIGQQLTIDGTTQAEYTTLPVIVIDGSAAGTGIGTNGLSLGPDSDGSTITALTIHSFDQIAIDVDTSDNVTITGSVLGLEVDGTTAAGNRYGIYADTSVGLTVGGTTAGERNTISDNDWGIALYDDSTDAVITGNHVGTDTTGLLDRGNRFDGVFVVNSSSRARIGGPTPAEANVIAGNDGDGVYVGTGSMVDAVIEGNLIGVGSDGTTLLGNDDAGINLGSGSGTLVTANVIGGGTNGIALTSHDDAVITANHIGTDAADTVALAFSGAAILIGSGVDDTTIGGAAPADANVIHNGGGGGVVLDGAAASGTAIIGNSIVANTGLGIDLGDDGVTTNDAGDVDTGPNDLLNHPVISSSIETTPGSLTTSIALDAPAATYRVEVFRAQADDSIDDSGVGEGETLLSTASVTHTGSGSESFDIVHSGSAGQLISVTATVDLGAGDYGSTSEFSRARTALGANEVAVYDTGDAADLTPGDGLCDTGGTNADGATACTLRAAIDEVNGAGGVDTIRFDIPTTDVNHTAGVWTISPGSALPTVTEAVDLDATTQPGWAASPGTPVIELDGTSAGVSVDGLVIGAPSTTVRGLSIGNFDRTGLTVASGSTSGTVIAGNHIGTDATGLANRGNGFFGLHLDGGSAGTTVGGVATSDRNVISGNDDVGLTIQSDNNVVLNNYVGTDVTGLVALANDNDGIRLSASAAGN
ncbi:MAG: right-handed parallel beta-helix repeat-containing protein, partial [Actinomycetota bacterium]